MTARIALAVICTVLAASPSVIAMVAAMHFERLVAGSGHIVLAKVYAIEKHGDNQVAKAHVLEVWKGPDRGEVLFNASPTWTCDISEAKVGETVVLFLGVGKPDDLVHIWHSGRGRMPVREVKGKQYADIWDDVILPEATPTIDGPEPAYSFIRSIDLSLLKDLVTEFMKDADGR